MKNALVKFIKENGQDAERNGLRLKHKKVIGVALLPRFNSLVNLFFKRELRTVEEMLQYDDKIMMKIDGSRSYYIEGKM